MPTALRDALEGLPRPHISQSEATGKQPTLVSVEPAAWPRGVQAVTPGRVVGDVQTAAVNTLLALGARQHPVLLAGKVGVGKSTVAAIVARSFQPFAWFGCDELLTTMMACRSEGSVQRWDAQGYAVHTTEAQLLRRIEQAPMVVLDDVGTRVLSEAQAEALRAVLDARVGRPLLVTTNCDTQALRDSVGARNLSRLLAGSVVRIGGADLRSAASTRPRNQ